MKFVPDAIHHTDTSETLEYITGWNDCRAAMLAKQPAQQEPVAWWDAKLGVFDEKHFDQLQPLYTSPPAQRKPLTEPQKQALAENWFSEDWAITKAIGMMFDHERLLGIKENT